jgi:hypothetical protein
MIPLGGVGLMAKLGLQDFHNSGNEYSRSFVLPLLLANLFLGHQCPPLSKG